MRYIGVITFVFLCASISSSPLSGQVPPGTGAGGGPRDPNFQIVAETLSPHEIASPAAAWVVTKLAGWGPELSGSHWIAPDPDQSNATRNGKYFGSVTYQTQFMATPGLTLNTRVLADDGIVATLNGKTVFTSTGGQYLFAAMFKMTGFVSGMNTVTFVVSNSGGGPTGLDVAFADAGAPPSGPALALNYPAYPDIMTFPSTNVGSNSAQTLYVVNNGDSTAMFSSIGPPTGSFSIDPKTQSCGGPLASGSYCTFSVVFAPTSGAPAAQTGTLTISLQGAANPSTYTLNLTGTAVGVVSTGGAPSLTFSPASLAFPTTPVGTASVEQLVKITNSGSGPAVFSDANVPSTFTIDWKPPTSLQACPQMFDAGPNLAAGASCAVGITFKPATAAPVAGNLAIDLCPPCTGTFYNLPLSGAGGSAPVLTFSPNPLAFPPTPAGSISAPISVTVQNTGSAVGTISGLPMSGIFALGANAPGAASCVPSIAAGATCTMTFTFRPPATAAAGTILTADPLATPPNPLTVFLAPGGLAFSLSASGGVTAAVIAPAVTLSANSLNFSSAVGVAMTLPLAITNSGSSTLNIASLAITGSNTFGFSPDCTGSAIAPGKSCTLNVTFTPTGAGSVQGSLVINDNATPPQQTVALIGIGAGPTSPPLLTVFPSVLNFKGLAAGPAVTQPLLVANLGGGGPLDFTVTVPASASWLSIAPGAGKTDVVASASVDFPSLSPTVLRSNISVAGTSGGPIGVDVNVLALPAGPVLSVSQSGLVFTLTAGVGTSDSSVVSILNQGNADMPWTADFLAGSNFLSISPAAGTTAAGGVTALTIAPMTAAMPNASDLAAHDYYGLVRISSPGAANSPQYVLTVLHVSGTSQFPAVRPGGLVLVSAGGAASDKVHIVGSSADTYAFAVTSSSPDGLKWLSATPASGSVSSSSPIDIAVTANPLTAGLKPGLYTGEVDVTLTATVLPSGSPSAVAVPVLLVVLPAGAKLAAPSARPGSRRTATTGCTPSSLGMAETGQPGGFSIRAGWPTPLTFTVLDDCANPVTNAQVIVTFSNGDPALVAGLTDPSIGQYSATWVPGKVVSSVLTTFTAKAAAGALTPAQVRYSGNVASNPAPLVNRNGTVHQMYPQPGAPLAPGTLVQINGSGLATANATPSDVPLPTTVNGTSALIGAYSVPLISLSDGTLAAQMPVELAPNNQYPIIVSVNDMISTPDFITVAANTPGIQATVDGHATAQHPDQSAVTTASPAAPGEVVSIFLSGLGATDPVVANGVQAPAAEPLARIKTPVILMLNGNAMAVGYAGLAPGQVGLYRVDFTVSQDTVAGDQNLSVIQNGLISNTVLLTVGSGN